MAWERLRRKCRSGIISPCSRTFPARCCPRLPGIAHDCPLKKCCKPGWPRNPAVDLAALNVSRALLRDSPAVRLSQRIMNQGLSWRAAQAGANSEVFTNHETRNTNHGFFAVGAPGWGHRKPPSGPLRPPSSRCFPVHRCSPLFAIVHQKILFGASVPAPPGRPFPPPGRCFAGRVRAAWSGYRAACAGGVGREPVSVHRQPFSVGLAASAAAGQLPLPRTQNEPMLRKGNVLVCVDTRSSTRRARRLAEVRVSGPGPARYSANRERANLLHSGGGKKVIRPVSIMGAVPMESAEDIRTRACVRKMFQEAEPKRVVRPDGSGIRFPRSTSS